MLEHVSACMQFVVEKFNFVFVLNFRQSPLLPTNGSSDEVRLGAGNILRVAQIVNTRQDTLGTTHNGLVDLDCSASLTWKRDAALRTGTERAECPWSTRGSLGTWQDSPARRSKPAAPSTWGT